LDRTFTDWRRDLMQRIGARGGRLNRQRGENLYEERKTGPVRQQRVELGEKKRRSQSIEKLLLLEVKGEINKGGMQRGMISCRIGRERAVYY